MKFKEEGEGEEGGNGNLGALGAIEFLNQEVETIRTSIVDAHNGFNKLNRLAILWTVRHFWTAEARFALNCYMHWVKILLRYWGEQPVTILSREGVT